MSKIATNNYTEESCRHFHIQSIVNFLFYLCIPYFSLFITSCCCCCFALARISRVAHSLGGGAHAGLLGVAFHTGLSFVESFFYSHYDICCFSQFSYIIPEYVIIGNTQASSVCHFRAFLDDVFLGFLFRLAKSALVIRFGSFFEIVFYW